MQRLLNSPNTGLHAFLHSPKKIIHFPFILAVVLLLSIALSSGCVRKGAVKPYTGGEGQCTGNVSIGNKVLKTAKSKTGIQYRRGGNSPETGFDCSGFVSWVFKQHGINVPRTSREQMQFGRAVNRNELCVGDIVSFRISARRGYHTGIYSGNGKFIHSPSSGKSIQETSLSDEYWSKRYLGARRVKQLE